ncbi:ectoine/hydroxyectoine ABC transporter permease subunit EhuC [soil metagenome]
MPPFDLLPRLLDGLRVTIILVCAAGALGLGVSFIAGLARLSSRRLIRTAAATYVEVFRGTSALVQVFFWAFVAPLLGVDLPLFAAGVVALGLNVGAYGSEVVRGAILAVDKGQREAALALNMPHWLMMRRIVVPQALLAMLPPFGNLLIELMKGTALVSLISITELTFAGRQILQTEGLARRDETYLLTLILYILLAIPMILAVRRLERRAGRGLGLGVVR